jgi:hypothetical protein
MPSFINLIGKQIGRWTVLRRTSGTQTTWVCRCACGSERMVSTSSLRSGMSKSCGCLQKEIVRKPRMSDVERGLSHVRGMLRFRAKRQGLECTLSDELINVLSKRPCFYCGHEPTSQKYIREMRNRENSYIPIGAYSGIDRVDNSKGYTPVNSVPCCWECNRMKRDYTCPDFIERASKIIAGLRRFGCR